MNSAHLSSIIKLLRSVCHSLLLFLSLHVSQHAFEMNEYWLAALCFVFTASVSSLFKQHQNWSAHWPSVVFSLVCSARISPQSLNSNEVICSFF